MKTNHLGANALLETVDLLIDKYSVSNPELVRDLVVLRAELECALKKRSRQETAILTLKIATWVRYALEYLTHL